MRTALRWPTLVVIAEVTARHGEMAATNGAMTTTIGKRRSIDVLYFKEHFEQISFREFYSEDVATIQVVRINEADRDAFIEARNNLHNALADVEGVEVRKIARVVVMLF